MIWMKHKDDIVPFWVNLEIIYIGKRAERN